MKVDYEKIIKYLDDDLTPDEKITFENELRSSSDLREELEKYMDVKKRIIDTKKIKLNPMYLNSIISGFRNKSIHKKSVTVKSNLGYALAMLLIFILSIVIWKNVFIESSNVNALQEFTESLNENQKIELLENLNGDLSDYPILADESLDLKVTGLIQSEIQVNEYIAETYDINYAELIDALDEREADKIYNEILNKNFSEEVNL